ncbi:MAG: hypothetical protein K6F47_01695 [Bacteroidaceae bacterium]|nr:hypothetical protein [Bacteroidaceae bacterium]
MKQILVTAILSIAMAMPAQHVYAGEKDDAHVSYVLKNMKLSKADATKVKPLLYAYYKEMSNAKASHKALKEKYSKAEDAGKLTTAQCDELFESKQKQEMAQLAVKKSYYAKMKTVLPAAKAYKLMKLTNDKVK